MHSSISGRLKQVGKSLPKLSSVPVSISDFNPIQLFFNLAHDAAGLKRSYLESLIFAINDLLAGTQRSLMILLLLFSSRSRDKSLT